MSKFIDKLKQISQASPQPIGFRTVQTSTPKPKVQLVASLTQEGIDNIADYTSSVDALLLHISKSDVKTLEKIAKAASDIPCGVHLERQEEMKSILTSDCDFIVFSAGSTLLTALQDNKIGKVLELESSITDSLLRATNELPIDTVLIASEQKEDYPLTWQHLMLFQRFADLLSKPFLVPAPLNITAEELQALWKAGIKGIVVEVTSKQSFSKLQELRQTINQTDFPLVRKREKIEAMLPRISEPKPEVPPEEEEDE